MAIHRRMRLEAKPPGQGQECFYVDVIAKAGAGDRQQLWASLHDDGVVRVNGHPIGTWYDISLEDQIAIERIVKPSLDKDFDAAVDEAVEAMRT